MNRYVPELILAAVLAGLWLLVAQWQAPGDPLTGDEIQQFVARIEAGPIPDAQKKSVVRKLQSWGKTDDGRPVFMLNLMRFKPEIDPWPGTQVAPGTAEEVNERYEAAALDIALPKGLSMAFAGEGQSTGGGSTTLWGDDPVLDHWDRILVVRYPSRRTFFELLSDPEYQRIMHLKFAAVELSLVPMSEITRTPDLRLALAVLSLLILMGFGWFRSTRRNLETGHA